MSDAMETRVLFVDDEAHLRAATLQTLALAGLVAMGAASAAEALERVAESEPTVVVTDIRMPGTDGMALFRRLHALDPDLPVILVTGHGDVELAVGALKEGAYDFIAKPFAADRLVESVRRAAEKRGLVLENRRLREAAAAVDEDLPLIGETPVIQRLRRTLRQIADTQVDVLVEGETGSGKEVVASLLHAWSRRGSHPFVALNCGALPESVIESELFGYEAGAFTGAAKRRVGRIEHASGGTLFLDEIESMPPALQVRLLRVLETRSVEPLGTNERRELDLRVVAAAKVDLGDPAQRGAFREDLYYRLNVVTLRIPPLRERRADIPLLFHHFLARAARRFARPVPEVGASVRRTLAEHDWPGNVRELSHYAERVALGLDEEAESAEPALDVGGSLAERVERFEGEAIRETLRRHRGEVRASLEALGLPRKTFYDKLQRHGIDRRSFEA
ncbi:sigma-54-dependent transcriptional regulator [Aureimonas jatrophae]|uniref:Two-component system, NtrC family, C4-dicarboxylate transport response regulator DctD n=1 Tax=Aureimonas jatrophae TaxID=1166073 RepID=A0A1H0EW64_9HYPH|nr:sigma-54 dependent transcriptional regulator [Aureimonas jatrophae]MBB3950286.1 two-component system C4-dicarboxylate transport response regulator DctD [Aureimonas jatrophae]SDN86621.1 two-component system, NtrC family, C4-dicarboxylate transport response regulator DctD [Aureimonas jatrophae]